MSYVTALSKYTANFVDELVKSGVTDVVLSPGSRSTPLALTVREHEGLKDWIIIDERTAAFFALGIAKKTNNPVALICTSGTAAANFYPAIVEAFYSRVPLIVLTTDRPHELRDIGAPQAINQIGMYASSVKWFHEMALPEGSEQMLRYVRRQAARAVFESQTGNKGPVHLNFPFREPLVPDFSIEDVWGESLSLESSYAEVVEGDRTLSQGQAEKLISLLESNNRGVIVYGADEEKSAQQAVVEFAKAWQLPILADPLSQLRSKEFAGDIVIDSYDAILRESHTRKFLKPDFIIRFGAMPVSKMYLFYLQEHSDVPQFVVEQSGGYREPTNQATSFLYADARTLCEQLMPKEQRKENDWLHTWQNLEKIVYGHLQKPSEEKITEGEAVRGLREVIPNNSTIFAANSMPIRDIDTFFIKTDKTIHFLGNRGVNGIDGIISTALGATIRGERVTLVIGDLSFYHDLNGLLIAKQFNLNMTILLVNNDGGGIFSFLPQAKEPKHFEAIFGTPIGIDFKPAINMYGGHYELVKTENELKEKLEASYEREGLSVIEVQTNREENVKWHRDLWKAINKDIEKFIEAGEE